MAITQNQLNEFQRFATNQVSQAGEQLTWPELFDRWRLQNPTARQQAEIYAALEESFADMQNGRHRPAGDVMSELKARHTIHPSIH